MKHFAAYYAGAYAYNDTDKWAHPWFPSFNPQFEKAFDDIVNLGEWEGVAGQKAKLTGKITYDALATFDNEQTDPLSLTSRNTPRAASRSSWT